MFKPPLEAVQAIQMFLRAPTHTGEALVLRVAPLGIRSCCAHRTVGLSYREGESKTQKSDGARLQLSGAAKGLEFLGEGGMICSGRLSVSSPAWPLFSVNPDWPWMEELPLVQMHSFPLICGTVT